MPNSSKPVQPPASASPARRRVLQSGAGVCAWAAAPGASSAQTQTGRLLPPRSIARMIRYELA